MPTFALSKKIYAKRSILAVLWKDAGVDDRGGLENRCSLMGTQGSNPCLSATRGLYNNPQNLKTSDCQTVLRFFHALPAVSLASHLPSKSTTFTPEK